MQPTQELVDDIYREKVHRARTQSPGEKLLDGFVVFNNAKTIAEAGIRHQMPQATDDEVRIEFVRRLGIARRFEEVGWIRLSPSAE